MGTDPFIRNLGTAKLFLLVHSSCSASSLVISHIVPQCGKRTKCDWEGDDKDNKNNKLLMMICGSQKYVYRAMPVILKAQLNHWMLPKDGLGWILFKFWSSLTNLPCKHSSTIQNEPCFPFVIKLYFQFVFLELLRSRWKSPELIQSCQNPCYF